MKTTILTIAGAAGSALAAFFGGWDAAFITLTVFMVIDYITGFILATVFHNSTKTENGSYESRAGFKGLIRKFVIFLLVGVATSLDTIIGTSYIRDAVCIAFMVNEVMSILENAGLMGVPLPDALIKALEVLKSKNDKGVEE